jgi:hypothetical protein
MWRDRIGAVGYVLAVIALLGAFVWFEARKSREPAYLSLGREECAYAYREARTAADSGRVDLRHPATGNQKDPNAPTCGTLRRLGKVP